MLRTELNMYNRELEGVKAEIKTAPPGRLIRRKAVYTHLINNKETGITNNKDIIQKLCRKKYLMIREKQLNKNISVISKASTKIDDSEADEIIESLSAPYSGLPKAYFFHPLVETWLTEKYRKNTHKQDECIYESENGTLVRSKSEQTIANLLEKHDIPYRYDAVINLGDKLLSPDFIIMNPFTGNTIIWEHFGALHKKDYEVSMNKKMDHYRRHGYMSFKTIIYTFEFNLRDNRFLQELIDHVIKSN